MPGHALSLPWRERCDTAVFGSDAAAPYVTCVTNPLKAARDQSMARDVNHGGPRDALIKLRRRSIERRRAMTQVYFHCSSTQGVLVDQRGTCVVDLMEAIEAATNAVRSRVAEPNLIDWRDWTL